MLLGSALLFALVMAALWVVFCRPGLARRLTPAQWIVGGGLVLPALVLPPLVAWALVAGERLLPLPTQQVARIDVVAENWAWRFAYPDHGEVETIGVLHLPAGEPVDLHITSRDVIHSFWAPRLAGKLDAIPGKTNILRLQADTPGSTHGQCAEYCGTGHAFMRFSIQVHAAGDYALALEEAAAGGGE